MRCYEQPAITAITPVMAAPITLTGLKPTVVASMMRVDRARLRAAGPREQQLTENRFAHARPRRPPRCRHHQQRPPLQRRRCLCGVHRPSWSRTRHCRSASTLPPRQTPAAPPNFQGLACLAGCSLVSEPSCSARCLPITWTTQEARRVPFLLKRLKKRISGSEATHVA